MCETYFVYDISWVEIQWSYWKDYLKNVLVETELCLLI